MGNMLPDCGVDQSLNTEVTTLKKRSKISNPNDNLLHEMQVALAKHYLENLKEEVKKGMQEKAEQGMYPGHAPYGYRHDRLMHTVVVDAQKSRVVKRIFAECGARRYASLDAVRSLIKEEFGVLLNSRHIHRILRNKFYTGLFVWNGKTYEGTHPAIVSPQHFQRAQKKWR